MNKFVVFLGCNKKQLPYLKRLKKLDFKIILIDQNKKSIGIKISDFFFNSSYLDLKKLNIIYNKIKKKNIVSVFTASSQFAHLGCSFLAKKLKLSYPSLKNINICLCKNLFYNLFKKQGLRIPIGQNIRNKKELIHILKNKKNTDYFYLKSDYGKSPFYLYKGSPEKILKSKINWKKNQFLKKNYILQKKFPGKNLRINIFKGNYEIFDFYNNRHLNKKNFPIIKKLKIPNKFNKISQKLKLKNWILKFDIIINKRDYLVLDMGIDPPSRMIKYWKKLKKDFIGFYLNLYVAK